MLQHKNFISDMVVHFDHEPRSLIQNLGHFGKWAILSAGHQILSARGINVVDEINVI